MELDTVASLLDLTVDSNITPKESDGFDAKDNAGHDYTHSIAFGFEICNKCGHAIPHLKDIMIKLSKRSFIYCDKEIVYCFNCIKWVHN